jgi:hypothetical protein
MGYPSPLNHTLTHDTHSETCSLLTSSLSLGVPVSPIHVVTERRVDSSDLVFSLSSDRHSEIGFIFRSPFILDGIPGVVPDLVTVFQGWKCPGSLSQSCCEFKSLKFILSDSNFLCPPDLNTLVTLGIYPSVN